MVDEKLIWDRLMDGIGNPYGVAGVMGNLFAESSLNPLCITGEWVKVNGNKDGRKYLCSVDRNTFIHDGTAFGLAQWRYWSRKESLWDFATAYKGDNILFEAILADEKTQIDFLLKEIKTYKTVWNTLLNATNVKEASDIVLERYEQPASVSDKTKKKRAQFGQGYFDKYAKQDEPTPMKRYVEITKRDTNLRAGNSKKFAIVEKALLAGTKYEWVATSDNNWHAVVAKSGKRVLWVSGDYSKITDG